MPTRVTEGEFRVDDRAVEASDYVSFFVTGGDLLETVQYLWSEFDWVRLSTDQHWAPALLISMLKYWTDPSTNTCCLVT